jgi:hypothetical protein
VHFEAFSSMEVTRETTIHDGVTSTTRVVRRFP